MSEGDPNNGKPSLQKKDSERSHDSSTPGAPELVVGIGASAGGIGALKDFFTHTSPGTGAAYVVILHLSPDHESRLAEVLQMATRMPVSQVRGEMAPGPPAGHRGGTNAVLGRPHSDLSRIARNDRLRSVALF